MSHIMNKNKPFKQMTIRLPAEIHKRLRRLALEEETTARKLAEEGIEMRLKLKEVRT